LVKELVQSKGRKSPEGIDPSGRHSFATSEEPEGGILEWWCSSETTWIVLVMRFTQEIPNVWKAPHLRHFAPHMCSWDGADPVDYVTRNDWLRIMEEPNQGT
jgi:hypothetical protein